jgi:hypothetical protein
MVRVDFVSQRNQLLGKERFRKEALLVFMALRLAPTRCRRPRDDAFVFHGSGAAKARGDKLFAASYKLNS